MSRAAIWMLACEALALLVVLVWLVHEVVQRALAAWRWRALLRRIIG